MAQISIAGDTSGTVTLAAPAVSGTTTLTLPTTSGTVVADTATQTLTNKTLTSPTIATPTITGQATIPTINLTGGQITFPSTQSASADANTLDDYEEGTWTPVFIGASTAGSCTYNTGLTNGAYVKIGQLVYVTFSLVATSTHSGTGTLNISGLPFTISSASTYGGSPSIGYFGSLAVACTYISGYSDAGFTRFALMYTAGTSGSVSSATPAFIQNNAHIIGTFVYRASA